ncbi:MAG: NUDIX hydrolase, partial [Pseudomonadota bacterium]
MKFCSECASPVVLQIPVDDTRERFVCSACGTIHYQNPKMVVGSIPVWEEDGVTKILLCKRAIEPRLGFWTLPAGFMENYETTAQAAQRETEEEAGITIKKLIPICNYFSTPGGSNEFVHLFCGIMDSTQAGGIFGLIDEGEDIKAHVIPVKQAFHALDQHKI